jgi:hypothetical protein
LGIQRLGATSLVLVRAGEAIVKSALVVASRNVAISQVQSTS